MSDLMRQVAAHLQYMHNVLDCIHGDFKSRNICLIEVERREQWIIIDLDASCTIGASAGQKITSSACYPPEMARRHLGNQAEVIATEAFEMWYFGLLLLQLCTVNAPTLWPSDLADNILEQSDIELLAYFWCARV